MGQLQGLTVDRIGGPGIWQEASISKWDLRKAGHRLPTLAAEWLEGGGSCSELHEVRPLLLRCLEARATQVHSLEQMGKYV